jgi:hypothetical protein
VNEPPASKALEDAQLLARRIRERIPEGEGKYCQALLYVIEQAWEGGMPAVRTIEQLYTGPHADGLYSEAERLIAFKEQVRDDETDRLLEVFEDELNPPTPTQ